MNRSIARCLVLLSISCTSLCYGEDGRRNPAERVIVGELFDPSVVAHPFGVGSHAFRVLLTGFVPFGSYPSNPSQKTAELLHAKCTQVTKLDSGHVDTVCFDSFVLPVNETGSTHVADMLNSTIQGHLQWKWDAVIHMGLEDVARGLKLETMALNYRVQGGGKVSETGPDLLATTAHLGALHIPDLTSHLPLVQSGVNDYQINDNGQPINEAWSRDAGKFYCNETLYRTLLAIRSGKVGFRVGRDTLLPAMFVHLPEETDISIDDDAKLIAKLAAFVSHPLSS